MSELTVTMPKVAAHAALRHLRKCRDHIQRDRDLLQRKHATVGNGPTADAVTALDNELYLIEEAISALWRAYNDGQPL